MERSDERRCRSLIARYTGIPVPPTRGITVHTGIPARVYQHGYTSTGIPVPPTWVAPSEHGYTSATHVGGTWVARMALYYRDKLFHSNELSPLLSLFRKSFLGSIINVY